MEEAAEPETKKLKAIIQQLELSMFKEEYPTVFINSILKFLTIYELQNLYQRLNNDMRQWWNAYDVWKQLCIINMGPRFQKTERYVINTIPRSEALNYKWLLFAWEWLHYFYERFTDQNDMALFDIWLPNFENDVDDRMLVTFEIK